MDVEEVRKVFESAAQTQRWAHTSYKEFMACRANFLKTSSNPRSQIVEFDPATGHDVVYLTFENSFPDDMIKAATQAIQYPKIAIDQALVAACKAFDPDYTMKPTFPWAQSPENLENLLERRRIPEALRPLLRRAKPYRTGRAETRRFDQVRAMADIANDTKHNVNLTVFPTTNAVLVASRSAQTFTDWMQPPIWDAANNRMELFRIVHGSAFQDDTTYVFDLSLDTSGPLMHIPADKVMRNFGEYAAELIGAFCEEVRVVC